MVKPRINCKNCNEEFAYDDESGLNVVRQDAGAEGRTFRLPGTFPCCPKCDSFNDREQKESSTVEFKTVWLPTHLEDELVDMMVEEALKR